MPMLREQVEPRDASQRVSQPGRGRFRREPDHAVCWMSLAGALLRDLASKSLISADSIFIGRHTNESGLFSYKKLDRKQNLSRVTYQDREHGFKSRRGRQRLTSPSTLWLHRSQQN